MNTTPTNPPMKVVCDWCVPKRVLREGTDPATGTMCPICYAREMAALDELDAQAAAKVDTKEAR